MSDFVIDASVALAWCFDNEATAESLTLLDRFTKGDRAVVPTIFGLEMANVLTMAERRKRLTAADVVEFVDLLSGLNIHFDDDQPARALGTVLDLARREGLSSYDAAYLDCAMRHGLPLATRDAELAKAARRCGVELIAG